MLSRAGTFENCHDLFANNATLQAEWAYHGPTYGLTPDPTRQITVAGCYAVCGEGSDYYPWSDTSATLTTWILPTIGVLLQAPFESINIPATCLLVFRWMGNPIASMAYILWNIKVIGKCAIMVDMSIPCGAFRIKSASYVNLSAEQEQKYRDVRDSLYILSAMNQWVMDLEVKDADGKPILLDKQAVEQLLRMALFSSDIRLRNPFSEHGISEHVYHHLDLGDVKLPDKRLRDLRRKIADNLRQHRRRGVVPVFISTLWFIFALALSIQGAFGLFGENLQAHNLGLGLLLSWLPVLVLATIVDRNFVATKHAQKQLNKLVSAVVDAWTTEASTGEERDRVDANMKEYINTFAFVPDESTRLALKNRAENVREWAERMKGHDLFIDFAGQGRLRWHYGCAHSILTSIERSWIAEQRRPWLAYEEEARLWLVLGDPSRTPFQFDVRDIWEILTAAFIVLGTITGGFILSFFTPPIAVGCRSGSYMIFAVDSIAIALIEFLAWFWTVDSQKRARRILHWTLCALEFINFVWLCYALLAQSTGQEQRCECMTSNWTPVGGYLDWAQYKNTDTPLIHITWPVGTSLGISVMGLSLLWVVEQWCVQSHMSTENYTDAQIGLHRVRWFRRFSEPFRHPFRDLYEFTRVAFQSEAGRPARDQRGSISAQTIADVAVGRPSLRWQWSDKYSLEALHGVTVPEQEDALPTGGSHHRTDSHTALLKGQEPETSYGSSSERGSSPSYPAAAALQPLRIPRGNSRGRTPSITINDADAGHSQYGPSTQRGRTSSDASPRTTMPLPDAYRENFSPFQAGQGRLSRDSAPSTPGSQEPLLATPSPTAGVYARNRRVTNESPCSSAGSFELTRRSPGGSVHGDKPSSVGHEGGSSRD